MVNKDLQENFNVVETSLRSSPPAVLMPLEQTRQKKDLIMRSKLFQSAAGVGGNRSNLYCLRSQAVGCRGLE